ncbi:spore germination protein PB [Bacillus mesophilus]|uniref:Spore gernimation protein n=1 Tax=Bacillus mesophilus TaxID=1808955 RepID=A0A6M0Q2R2_9BACI|nr:spore germination protein GerPB [Bacillus mesophilus]MBM7659812.1 spore germination protein PB [Bacillus mesophilus]NEY70671.1 spore gernimation protein [Bacillus mesophilus]
MNFYIHQNININMLKVGSVSNSSVLQIGSAGLIKPLSNLYNTGGFKEPAPVAGSPGGALEGPVVPLTPPTS